MEHFPQKEKETKEMSVFKATLAWKVSRSRGDFTIIIKMTLLGQFCLFPPLVFLPNLSRGTDSLERTLAYKNSGISLHCNCSVIPSV